MSLPPALHDFLTGCWWDFAFLLPFVLWVWYDHRLKVRGQIAENQAGRYCTHGKNPARCMDCAAKFFAEPVVKPHYKESERTVTATACEISWDDPDPAPVAPAARPLRILLPDSIVGESDLLTLEFTTGATWGGHCVRAAVVTKPGRVWCAVLGVPPSVCNYRYDLTRSHGYGVSEVVIEDATGLDFLRVICNGGLILEGTLKTLDALARSRE